MIPEQNEGFFNDKNTSFTKQINGCHFYCQIIQDRLRCQLIDIEDNHYYEIEYSEGFLPKSITKHVNSLHQLYQFITAKSKIFKVPHPGTVMCCQYMGRIEKFITIELQVIQPTQELTSNGNFMILKKICRELFFSVNKLKAELRIKNRQITLKHKKTSLSSRQSIQTQNHRKSIRKSSQNQKLSHCPIKQQYISLRSHKKQTSQEESKIDVKQSNVLDSFTIKIQELPISRIQAKFIEEKNAKQEERIVFNVDQSCPYYHNFKIVGNRLEKINNSQPFILHSSYPISHRASVCFTVQISKTKYRSISIGVIALEYYEQLTKELRRRFSICYDGYYGVILNEQKQERQRYQRFREGDIVKTIIDLDKKQISWVINLQFRGKTKISQRLIAYELFPYIQLEDKGDIVILNRKENNCK